MTKLGNPEALRATAVAGDVLHHPTIDLAAIVG